MEWFKKKHRLAIRRCRGIIKEGSDNDVTWSSDKGIMTDRLVEHFRKLKSKRRASSENYQFSITRFTWSSQSVFKYVRNFIENYLPL